MRQDELQRYESTAYRNSLTILRSYSTSFGWAARLLSNSMEQDIAAVYAMVRVADEIVDGTAHQAGVPAAEAASLLDDYERRVLDALERGFSTDLVLHAFARTATSAAFSKELIRPFFSSMRTDLAPVNFVTASELDDYVYGSAEVVGLMCLQVFTKAKPLNVAEQRKAELGARALGSAFQRINFLRDLGYDGGELRRRYLPEVDPQRPDETGKALVLARIRADLTAARATLPLLPLRPRRAVCAALGLFAELADRIERMPARSIATGRVSVPTMTKARILASSVAGGSGTSGSSGVAGTPDVSEANR